MNDMIDWLQQSGCGIPLKDSPPEVEQPVVPCLLFADDIVLTGGNWNDLAIMLSICDVHTSEDRYWYELVLMPPTKELLIDLEIMQIGVLRDATEATPRISHAVLLRLANC